MISRNDKVYFPCLNCNRCKFTADAVKAKMARPADGRDMLSRFIEAKHANGSPLSLDEVLLEARTVVGAGSDTTGISPRAILYYIITNPELYAKLMGEINALTKDGRIWDQDTFSESLKNAIFLRLCQRSFENAMLWDMFLLVMFRNEEEPSQDASP